MSINDARRSTAAQYFIEEEAEPDYATEKQVVDLLNNAATAVDEKIKVDNLKVVHELILNKCPNLLDNFLDEILGFQNDRNAEVRKAVVVFIEEASKKEPDLLPRLVGNLVFLLQDSSSQVQKRTMQAAAQVYRCVLMWVSKVRTVTSSVERTWLQMNQAKSLITQMVDHDNDGIRTNAIKFLEAVVLLQTYPDPDSLKRPNDFSLEDLPMALKIARRRKLEEEAIMTFDLMLKFHGSVHISSVNLMSCMGSLTLIAKMRPQFMAKVVTAMESLHTNLPPTLSKSQVSSVRKHLKLQLLNLLKHPASYEVHSNITTLLMDLGATQQEIAKNSPKPDEVRRRQKRLESLAKSQPVAKKPRVEIGEPSSLPAIDDMPVGKTDSDVDLLEQYISDRLAPDVVTQVVMQAMGSLPDRMPATFSASYTPIAAAGTSAQIQHVARLMATQLNLAGFGPECTRAVPTQSAVFNKRLLEDDDDDDDLDIPPRKITATADEEDSPVPPPAPEVLAAPPTLEEEAPQQASTSAPGPSKSKPRIKTLKLAEITKPLSSSTRSKMIALSVQRILRSEKLVAQGGGVCPIRNKILTTLASQYRSEVREEVLHFILEDVKSHAELALQWLYEEFSFVQGFSRSSNNALRRDDSSSIAAAEKNYNRLFCSLVHSLLNNTEPGKDRDALLWRLYLESPFITDDATELLKSQCADEMRSSCCLALLQQLVIRRPPRQLIFLNCILIYTAHESIQIRGRAVAGILELYGHRELQSVIEEYAILYLGFLRLADPPEVLFGEGLGRLRLTKEWADNTVRACLYLYLALLPSNESLIHDLAKVYVQTNADVKRTILRLLEQPVRGMGMESPQLLKLVEDCPKGAETLVTRVIHILTEKTPPSADLVARVRDLYQSRVSDVRFLIPVLNGLTKPEVIAALPKLIKLNPVVVKEVFNRLLGTHSEGSSYTSPLTPAELLVALHNIDPTRADMKTIIKATSLCFTEQQAYTQEVLAVVLQTLMDQTPVPVLLMRTVIQSLALYPRLVGFVMNILQRLITKQVWNQKKVWEGFVKCCQRTKPQSFQVLLQLPAEQLQDVFKICPDLHQPLLEHVLAFTENQRAHVPQKLMDVLMGTVRPDPQPGPPGED